MHSFRDSMTYMVSKHHSTNTETSLLLFWQPLMSKRILLYDADRTSRP